MYGVQIPIDPKKEPILWLSDRRGRITATDGVAILGLGYKSPLELYLEKIGVEDGKMPSLAMRIGQLAEDMALTLYTEQTGREVVKQQLYLRHPERDWQAATIDGLDTDGNLVEVKTVGLRSPYLSQIGEPGTAELPTAWLCQVQHQLEVTGADVCHVAVLMGTDFGVYTVERDPHAGEGITELEANFRERHIQALVPPKAERPDDTDVLARLFPKREGEAIWTDTPAVDWIRDYVALGEELSQLEKQRKLIKGLILEMMGPLSSVVTGDGYQVTTKQVTRKAYQVAESSYLDFRVKSPKA